MVSVASLFAQVLSLISRRGSSRAVRNRDAEKTAKGFSCWDQFVAMLFCRLYGGQRPPRYRRRAGDGPARSRSRL